MDLTVDSTGVFVVYTTFENLTNLEGLSYIKKYDTLANVIFENNIINTFADPLLTARRIYTTPSAIYTLFSYCGEINLTNGTTINPIGGGSEGLLIKHDSYGNIVWFKIFGGTGNDIPIDLTFDANENIYVTGHTNSPIFSFDSYSFLNSSNNIYLLKLDSSGVSLGLDKIKGNSNTTPMEIEWNEFQNKLYL